MSGSLPAPPAGRDSGGRYVCILGLCACLALTVAFLAGVFTVHSVRVVGVPSAEAAAVGTVSVVGDNIFTLRSDGVVDRLAAIPAIQVQRVQTSFPDVVTVYASVRRPVIAWRWGPVLDAVAADGTVVGQAAPGRLPTVIGPIPAHIDPAIVQGVSYAAARLPALPDGRLAPCRYGPIHGLTLEGQSGWTAVLGTGTTQTMVNRVATLAAVLQTISGTHRLQYADLRYRVPFVRYAP